MDKIRKKIRIQRVLQVVFYALGFPLFVHMVMLTARPVQESYLVGDINAYLAIIIAAVMWVVVILAQLLFRAICKKNRMARAVWVALIAAIITIAPVVYCDFMVKGEYDALVDKYVEEGLSENDFYNYEKALTKYTEMAEETNKEIDEYVEVFNLDPGALEGRNYGPNGDGSEYYLDEEAQAYYSPNGMFSDGYLFSLKQAIAVQKAYYENKLAFEAEGKDIDVELAKALVELEDDPYSDWRKYQEGASESSFKMEGFSYITSPDEYELAYGEDGYAKKFYVTSDRLDAIASVIGGKLGSCEEIGNLLSILTGTGLVTLPEGLDIDSLLTENLTVEKLIETINSIGNLGKTLADLIGTGKDTISEEDLMGLLESYSNYQSPSTYPIFYFLEDEALREYAYANYYGTIHGGKVGAVLVGENVGLMNLDNMSGTKNPYSASGLLKMFKMWDAQTELINDFYPIFAVRAISLKMSAAIVFCLLAAYWFTAKIDDEYAKLAVARK